MYARLSDLCVKLISGLVWHLSLMLLCCCCVCVCAVSCRLAVAGVKNNTPGFELAAKAAVY